MNDSLPQLPEYDPHPDLWARVEADLLADEQLGRAMQTLPDYEPKANLWDAIEGDLQSDEAVKIRPLWSQPNTRSLWAGLAAAAVVVLVGSWLFFRPEATETVRMEYAVEQLDAASPNNSQPTDSQSSADVRAQEFIAQQCAEQNIVCQRPEVHELRNQLTNLTTEQQRLDREQQIFGDDPALVRARVKLENQRADVTKELITLLRS